MKDVILVPVDGSDFSIKALHHALKVARGLDAELLLVNAQLSLDTRNLHRFFNQHEIDEYRNSMFEKDIQPALLVMKENSDITYSTKMLVGPPDKQICETAEQCGASLIVMGSRGLGAIRRTFLGSVSYGVLHNAPCPVTIVP